MIQKLVFPILLSSAAIAEQPADHLVFKGDASKPGKGKNVVLIAGDEEYRSEESMPMLAQILAKQGFNCTVLFSLDKEGKFVSPTNQESLSNPAALDSADAIVMAIRFRRWPDAAMDKFNAAFERGTPISALRTSTHPFNFKPGRKYEKFGWRNKEWKGGFGRQVLGETWVSHWGKHAVEGMRTYAVEANKKHPVLNGVGQIFCKSDLYEAAPLAPSTILLEGNNTATLERDSPDTKDAKGAKRQACAWVREYKHSNGKTNKIFTTTMGSADDLTDENLRRLVINSVYYNLGLEVPAKADATPVGAYQPTMFGFRDSKDGIRKGFIANQTPKDYINFVTPKK